MLCNADSKVAKLEILPNITNLIFIIKGPVNELE